MRNYVPLLKKAALVAFAALLSAGSVAQNRVTDTSTTIYSYFKKGERKVFRINETSTNYNYGFVVLKASAQYEATMTIVDDANDRYTIEWTLKTLSAEDKKYALYPLLANMRNGLTVHYVTNKQGTPLQLLNEAAIAQHLTRAYDSLTRNQNYDALNQAMVNQLPLFINSAGGLIDVYLKPLFLYHSPYGGEWVLRKPIYQAGKANNAYGGQDFPVVTLMELHQLKPKEDFAQLYYDQMANAEWTAEIMKDRVKEVIAEAKGREARTGELPEAIKMKDHNEFDITLSTGWVTRAFYERITKDRGAKKVDTIEILLQ